MHLVYLGGRVFWNKEKNQTPKKKESRFWWHFRELWLTARCAHKESVERIIVGRSPSRPGQTTSTSTQKMNLFITLRWWPRLTRNIFAFCQRAPTTRRVRHRGLTWAFWLCAQSVCVCVCVSFWVKLELWRRRRSTWQRFRWMFGGRRLCPSIPGSLSRID